MEDITSKVAVTVQGTRSTDNAGDQSGDKPIADGDSQQTGDSR